MTILGNFKIRIGAEISELKKALAETQKGIRGMQQSLTNLGSSLSSRLTLPLALAGGAVLKLAGDMEQTRIAFNTLVGDSEKAEQALSSLVSFSESTPFSFGDQVLPAGQKLLAFGESVENLVPVLRRLGDVSAGIGAPIEEIAEIYGKARISGRLFAEDINQLTGRGIPVIAELANQFGVAEADVRKLVESGQVGFANLEQAFISLTSEGGKFFNLTEQQSQSLLGVFSTFRDNLVGTLRSIGEALAGTFDIKGALVSATESLKSLTQGIRRLQETNPGLVRLIAIFGAVAAAIGPVLTGIGALVKILPLVKVGILALTGPVAGVIAGITALGTAVVLLVRNWDFVTDYVELKVKLLINVFKGLFIQAGQIFLEGIANMVDPLRRFADFIGAEGLSSSIRGFQDNLTNLIPDSAVQETAQKVAAILAEQGKLARAFNNRNAVQGGDTPDIAASSGSVSGSGSGSGSVVSRDIRAPILEDLEKLRSQERELLRLASVAVESFEIELPDFAEVFPEDSINALDEKMRMLRERFDNASAAGREELLPQIVAVRDELQRISETNIVPEGSLNALSARLNTLREEFGNASAAGRELLLPQIAEVQSQIDGVNERLNQTREQFSIAGALGQEAFGILSGVINDTASSIFDAEGGLRSLSDIGDTLRDNLGRAFRDLITQMVAMVAQALILRTVFAALGIPVGGAGAGGGFARILGSLIGGGSVFTRGDTVEEANRNSSRGLSVSTRGDTIEEANRNASQESSLRRGLSFAMNEISEAVTRVGEGISGLVSINSRLSDPELSLPSDRGTLVGVNVNAFQGLSQGLSTRGDTIEEANRNASQESSLRRGLSVAMNEISEAVTRVGEGISGLVSINSRLNSLEPSLPSGGNVIQRNYSLPSVRVPLLNPDIRNGGTEQRIVFDEPKWDGTQFVLGVRRALDQDRRAGGTGQL